MDELAKKHDVDLAGEQSSWIKAVGITNQRETTMAWNDHTGRLYYNAIVWDDTRTADVAETIIRENDGDGEQSLKQDVLRSKTGLPVASYFAGTKMRWLIDNIAELQSDLKSPTEKGNVRFGTIDTWLTYMLTGYNRSIKEDELQTRLGHEGGVFKTDVTNGSRWLCMDLDTLDWCNDLVQKIVGKEYQIPVATALPKIIPSSDKTIGTIHGVGERHALKNVPIAAILGDQQAALFGQACYQPGEAKCTYGTGLFLMMNTGPNKVSSTHGLLTTVAYQLKRETTGDLSETTASKPVYGLEGSVAFSGSTINWLRDQLTIISSASETEALALSVPSSQGMYLVPAFSGLFAPHWQADARGCMVGLTASHSKAHIVRSALESSAYQVGFVKHILRLPAYGLIDTMSNWLL